MTASGGRGEGREGREGEGRGGGGEGGREGRGEGGGRGGGRIVHNKSNFFKFVGKKSVLAKHIDTVLILNSFPV